MEQLIPIIGNLQDVLGALGQATTLNLPQIVVVGGQSSGKSSVLECLVGRSFLPRGNGIVTRRPLILSLVNNRTQTDEKEDEEEQQLDSDDNDDTKEWGEFLHLPGKIFKDFNAIRHEIISETERLTGKFKNISREPIHLKIYSPHVLHLTLVDLPGIAKVAIGDQPLDIEEQIHAMCLHYIKNPNAIILAITAGNTDLANSDALKLARNVDPCGERTVGVITKVDLMDPGTDVTEILANKVIPLRRGYVAVVNRGQLDIERKVSIKVGLSKEETFFMSNPSYRNVMNRCGSHNLAKTLNSVLMHHIRDCLPELRSRIINMLSDIQQELDALGENSAENSKSTMGGVLLGLLSKFASSFQECVDGRGSSRDGLEMNELYGGARIAYIFNEVFVRSLMNMQPFDALSDDEIRTTICNSNGTRTALFVPEISFELLAKRQIARLEPAGLQCVDLVFDELQRISSQCEPAEFTRFPVLRERMVEVVGGLLRRAVTPTQVMVSNLIKIELAYINTSHPDFIRGSVAVSQLLDKYATNRQDSQQLQPNSHRTSEVSATVNNNQPNIQHENAIANSNQNNRNDGSLMNFIFRSSNLNEEQHNKTRSSSVLPEPPSIIQLPQMPDTMRAQTDLPTDRERVETDIIKSLLSSYFSIVRKNFIDLVPKTIMFFLVNFAKNSIQNELVSELYRDSFIPELMAEAKDVAQRRKTCQEMRDMLGKAMEIVNEVRDFNTFK